MQGFILATNKLKEYVMNTKQKPACIQSEEIAAVAQQGVKRALAARKHMVELSSEQAADVGGGFYYMNCIFQLLQEVYGVLSIFSNLLLKLIPSILICNNIHKDSL
jgi:hypothetical protein